MATRLTGGALPLAALVLLLAGCNGGIVDRQALTNDSKSIDSMACEGALLARNAAAGKTTGAFAKEQADALREQSSNLADALTDRKALAAIEKRVRAQGRRAARLTAALERLRDHPSDRALARTVERQLTQLGDCA